jgi:hypothetical protein
VATFSPYIITQPAQVAYTATSGCSTTNTPQISISATGGSGSYIVSINGVAQPASASPIVIPTTSGIHTISVVDTTACPGTGPATIAVGCCVTGLADYITQVYCNHCRATT